jgi:hypothetical protein
VGAPDLPGRPPRLAAYERRCTLVLRPILADLWDKEFKVAASPRIKLRFIEKAEAQGSLFLAARFGLYSSGEYYEFLRKNFHGETLVYDAAFRATGWPGDFQSLLGLTAFFRRPTRQHIHSHAFFLLNLEDPFDVVDYWNLRASGTYLFPLTLQDYQECAKGIGQRVGVSDQRDGYKSSDDHQFSQGRV